MNNIGTDDNYDDDGANTDNGTDLNNNELKQMLKASYQDEPPDDIYGWKYDRDLSNATAKVYYNPNNNFAVVSHRGTKGLKDWKNNLSYAFGNYKNTDRYKKGKDTQNKVFEKYGKNNTITVGHSQGGILAHSLGKSGKQVINVNGANKFERPNKNEINIRSSGDVVSLASSLNNVLYPKLSKNDIVVPAKSINPLKNHDLNILDNAKKKKRKDPLRPLKRLFR
jgi:hypothetical protein